MDAQVPCPDKSKRLYDTKVCLDAVPRDVAGPIGSDQQLVSDVEHPAGRHLVAQPPPAVEAIRSALLLMFHRAWRPWPVIVVADLVMIDLGWS
jgi:hypothetical protein